MPEYNQYCPLARASEVLSDRWTLLIVRELLAGSRRFNEIGRGLPGISRSLLASRLRHLEKNGVIERFAKKGFDGAGYVLTEAGRELRHVVERIGAWGLRWTFGEPRPEELDPALLLWKVHQRIDRSLLPEGRTVVEFDFSGRHARRLWLLLEPREVSVCLKPPGFDSDLIVHADLATFYRVWLGQLDFEAAVRCGAIALYGPTSLARALPRWFLWSPIADLARAELRRQRPAGGPGAGTLSIDTPRSQLI